MPNTDAGKAIASRNATTHGLFARDVVLPSLGESPEGYRQLEDAWLAQLPPRTMLETHYVEKIAAASWRLRRLHRWQAQIFEDDTLTESERLDRLDKALRHETTLHRQIDTAVKMLAKDAPQLFAQRARDQVLADTRTAQREYRDDAAEAVCVDLAVQDRLYQIRKAAIQAANELSVAPLDAAPEGICENELPLIEAAIPASDAPAQEATADEKGTGDDGKTKKCENEPIPFYRDPRRITEHLNPNPEPGAERSRGRQRRRDPSRVTGAAGKGSVRI